MTTAAATSAPTGVDGVVEDPFDARLARSAVGLLREFNQAGLIDAADVHVALRLGRLGGEHADEVLLAAALTVRALRHGSVCVNLAEVAGSVLGEGEELLDTSGLPWPDPDQWVAACAASPLVAHGADAPGGRPLRLVDGLLYLERYWRQEELVRTELQRRARPVPEQVDLDRLRAGLDRLFPDETALEQRRAAAVCALRRVAVLAGGPGTGKTTTVARILQLLRDQPGPPPRVALAAPTGKAAAQLKEAVRKVVGPGDPAGELSASTLHRLLGGRPGSTEFHYHRHNRLPYDLVVVDETSMVSLTMMARLLEAVRPDARLLLVGDPDQLASVEAGAVLGDLTRAAGEPEPWLDTALAELGLPGGVVHGVVTLRHVHRFRDTIARFARAVQEGDADTALELLRADAPDLRFAETEDPTPLDEVREEVVETGRALAGAAREGRVPEALTALNRHRLLCAHRHGPYGVTRWSAEIEQWLAAALPGLTDAGEWYPGRPVLVIANDPETGLYNGDTGVVVCTPDGPRVAFDPARPPFAPSRPVDVTTVHAMTIHKAQGSQFGRVTVVLPPAESPLLTRELLYTAVTRAETFVRIVGSEDAVRAAVERPITRASGLRRRLAITHPGDDAEDHRHTQRWTGHGSRE